MISLLFFFGNSMCPMLQHWQTEFQEAIRNMNGGHIWEVSGLLGFGLYRGPAFLRQALTRGAVCTWSASWKPVQSKAWSSAMLFLETWRVGVLLKKVVTESIFQALSGHLPCLLPAIPLLLPLPHPLSNFLPLSPYFSVSLSLSPSLVVSWPPWRELHRSPLPPR